MIVYHTSALPQFAGYGWAKLGTRLWTEQLNREGMRVAEELGLFSVDVAAMTSHLDPPLYLRDGLHPQPYVLADVLNVVLNMWATRQNTLQVRP